MGASWFQRSGMNLRSGFGFSFPSFQAAWVGKSATSVSFQLSHNLSAAANRQDPAVMSCISVRLPLAGFSISLQLTDVTRQLVARQLPHLGLQQQLPQLLRRKTANYSTFRLNYFKLICTRGALSKDTFIPLCITELF